MNLTGVPAAELRAAVQQHFHQTHHPRALDFDAGDFGAAGGDSVKPGAGTVGSPLALRAVRLRSRPCDPLPLPTPGATLQFSSPLLRPGSLSRLTQISKRR